MLKIRYLWSVGAIACHALLSAVAPFSQPSHAQQLGAIVQLQDLDLPEPEVSGQTIAPLKLLNQSRGVYVLDVELGRNGLNDLSDLNGLNGLAVNAFRPSSPGVSGRFLLDTGASTTLLSEDLRQQLNLTGQPVDSSSLDYAVAGEDCPDMTAQRLSLPPLRIRSARVSQLEVLQFEQALIPDGADGVLGMDVLEQFQMNLDPVRRRLTLRPARPLSPAERLQAIPLESRSGVMLAQLSINEQGPFTVLVDTGADATFISHAVAETLNLAERQPIKMLGFCGLESAEMTTLEQVSLQGHRRRDLEAVITDSSVLSTLRVDGVLGQNFLNHFRQSWYFSDEENWLILALTQMR